VGRRLLQAEESALPVRRGRRAAQIRRYVYCDVVRSQDVQRYLDPAGVQMYIINQAKVVFLTEPTPAVKADQGARAYLPALRAVLYTLGRLEPACGRRVRTKRACPCSMLRLSKAQ
jgi:hypothetical protein